MPLQCRQALDLAKRVALNDNNFCTRQIQQAVNQALSHQDDSLVIDGKFGPATKKAVERWQEHIRLPVTGVMQVTDLMVLFPPGPGLVGKEDL